MSIEIGRSKFTLDDQIKQLEKDLMRLSEVEAVRAVNSAISKTLAKAKTATVRAVASELKIKQAPIRKRIYVSKTRDIARSGFGVLSMVRTDITAASIIGDKPRKRSTITVGGQKFSPAFVNNALGGTRQWYKRSGPRYPIEVIKVPLAVAALTRGRPAMERTVEQEYRKTLIADLKFRIGRITEKYR